jgi:hypothetical protein
MVRYRGDSSVVVDAGDDVLDVLEAVDTSADAPVPSP